MAILMGRWDCDACGRKGNIGDSYSCEGCGAGRPENVKFYLPKNAEVITDSAGIAAAKAGADWQCEYCDEWVPATKSVCPDCTGGEVVGSKRHQDAGKVVTKSDYRKVISIQDEYAGNDVEPVSSFIGNGDYDRVLREHAEDPPERKAPPPAFRGSFPPRANRPLSRNPDRGFQAIIAMLVLGFVALVGTAIFYTAEVPAKVSHHSWERVQKVEEYTRGISKDGWDHPSDAYDITTSQRIHHYDKVLDHYETEPVYSTRQVPDGTETYQSGTETVDLGNGRFERRPVYSTRTKYRTEEYQSGTREVPVYRDEPVYDTYYHYKVDRWVNSTPRVLTGLDLSPKWPSTEVRDSDQRMGGRSATYSVHFIELNPEKGKTAQTWSKAMSESDWRAYKVDDRYILVVGVGNGLREIKPMELEKSK